MVTTVAQLVERMTRLMQEARASGWRRRRLAWSGASSSIRSRDEEPVIALVNPRLTASGEEQETADEGCLSLGQPRSSCPSRGRLR